MGQKGVILSGAKEAMLGFRLLRSAQDDTLLPRCPAAPLPRFAGYVLTRANSNIPAAANTMFGIHAARLGSTTPPAPTAFMI